MSDPEKLRDDGDEFERSLLGAAVDEAEDGEREARTLAALGLGGPVGPGGPDGAGGGSAVGGALGKGLALVAIGGVVIAGAIALRSPATPAPEAQQPVVTPAPRVSAPVRKIEQREPIETVPSASVARFPPRPAPTVSAPAKNDPSSLQREIAALDRARAALKSGDVTRARAELDGYDREFPVGSLGPEARALRARVNKKASEKK